MSALECVCATQQRLLAAGESMGTMQLLTFDVSLFAGHWSLGLPMPEHACLAASLAVHKTMGCQALGAESYSRDSVCSRGTAP